MEEFFSKYHLFEDLTKNELKEFFSLIKEISLSVDEILLKQGELGTHLYFLKEGTIETYISDPNEYRYIVDNLNPPNIIGEMELFDNKPVIVTVRAKTECKLYVISYEDFQDFLDKYPLLNQRIVGIILSRWRNVENSIHQIIPTMLKSNEYLSTFASTVSHDLKTPLQTIMGYVHILKNLHHEKTEDGTLDYLNRIERSSQKINQLLKGIYNYSIAIQPSLDEFGIANIKEVIDEVIVLLAPSKDIQISINGQLPIIHSNKTQMIQVFQNLLDNAIKSLDKPEKRITINYKSLPHFWQFSITDNGIGIDKKDYKRIMKVFQRIDMSKERKGTGIGLAIVERIVILHGGRVWIESELGKGSTFHFTISKSMLQYMKNSD